jgi:hypothetical protein
MAGRAVGFFFRTACSEYALFCTRGFEQDGDVSLKSKIDLCVSACEIYAYCVDGDSTPASNLWFGKCTGEWY